MDKLNQQLERFSKINIWDVAINILIEYREEIIQMNRIQLLKGKTTLDQDITPNYKDDDYFDTRSITPKGYAIFKRKLGANPYASEKSFYTPDFLINGKLVHDALNAIIKGDVIVIEPEGVGATFDSKFKNIYGLNRENMDILTKKMYPKMMQKIKTELGYKK